jgi:hypothetical protein
VYVRWTTRRVVVEWINIGEFRRIADDNAAESTAKVQSDSNPDRYDRS